MFFGTYSIIHVFETCKDMKNEAQCLGPIKPQERGGDDRFYICTTIVTLENTDF